MKNQTLGRAGEEFAAQYLSALGYRILHRNFRSGHLETDIICENETHILFVEVKSRTDVGKPSRYGRPGSAVDYKKRQNLTLCAEEYLRKHQPKKKPRIDVIEVYLKCICGEYVLSDKGIKHIENAVF
jgi:putative endonuclease